MSAQAQAFWIQWVEDLFPDLEARAYFLPPVYFNRVPMTGQSIADQFVLLLQSASAQSILSNQPSIISTAAAQGFISQLPQVQDSDVRDDAAMQRIFVCLQKMAEEHNEIFVGMTQLQFGQYLGEPCYAAAAAQLPLPSTLPPSLPKNWKEGDFDFLVIHRQYGLVVCEVKAFGDNVKAINISQQNVDNNIRKKLTQAVSQLTKAEAMLSHLVSDIAPGLRITKMIAVPNLTANQVQQAISGNSQLTQALCQCLGTTNPADITGLCLCSDQLSDPKTPWDVSSDVLRELGNWWQRRLAGAGRDFQMDSVLYKTLVARFCGPATTVTVPCVFPPRLTVKTLDQAVSATGECYAAQMTLFPEQVEVLSKDPATIFLSGPPGTGKSVVLLLKGIKWMRDGHDVHVVSTGDGSCAVSSMLYNLMSEALKTQLKDVANPGQVHLKEYDFTRLDNVKKAVEDATNYLSQQPDKSLYIIADEAAYEITPKEDFFYLFGNLLTKADRIRIWAANCYHQSVPQGLDVTFLTQPLRYPPVVVREVKQDKEITEQQYVKEYSERGVPDHTDGPSVKRVYHKENATTAPPNLKWKDVLVVSGDDLTDDSGVVKGLKQESIPVQVMTLNDCEDVGMARSDVVWVASGIRVSGLERKVVVCLELVNFKSGNTANALRLHLMSRCTSQLLIVSSKDKPFESNS